MRHHQGVVNTNVIPLKKLSVTWPEGKSLADAIGEVALSERGKGCKFAIRISPEQWLRFKKQLLPIVGERDDSYWFRLAHHLLSGKIPAQRVNIYRDPWTTEMAVYFVTSVL